MKKLMLLLLVLCTITVKSQTDTSKLTVKYVYEDVKAGFTKLVNSLEGPAKATYAVYVKQYAIDGWSSLILESFFTILLGIFFVTALKKGSWYDDGPDVWGVFQIILGLFFIISVVVFAADFSGNLGRIMNPQYYAIRDIVSTITK